MSRRRNETSFWVCVKIIYPSQFYYIMNLSKNPSFKELWKYSCKQKKEWIKSKDYLTIIVASTISAASSYALSYIIKFNLEKFFKSPIIGTIMLITLSLALTIIFTLIIFISLKLTTILDRLILFLELIWKKWRPFSKLKN